MNKQEILQKSREENQDERNLAIAKAANENAYLVIVCVFAMLIMTVTLQKLLTGRAFADYRVFLLAMLLGYVGQNATVYHYNRERSRFVRTVVAVVGCILCLISLIVHSVMV